MIKKLIVILCFILITLLVSCGGGGGGSTSSPTTSGEQNDTLSKMVGDWEFDGNSSTWSGAKKSDGWYGPLLVNSDGTYVRILCKPDNSIDEYEEGTVTVAGSSVTWAPAKASSYTGSVQFSTDNNTLTSGPEVFRRMNYSSNDLVGTWQFNANLSKWYDKNGNPESTAGWSGQIIITAAGMYDRTLYKPDLTLDEESKGSLTVSGGTMTFDSTNQCKITMSPDKKSFASWNGERKYEIERFDKK